MDKYNYRLDKIDYRAQAKERARTESRLASGINAVYPQDRAKTAVLNHRKDAYWDMDHNRSFYEDLSNDDLYVVTFAYILGGWKCMISSDAWTDTSYYEVTYDVHKGCIYLDWYKKIENVEIPDNSDYKMACLRERLNRKKD